MWKQRVEMGDRQMQNFLGTLLRIGVLTSAFIVVVGAVMYFIQHHGETMDYTVFKSEPARLRQVHTILIEALQLRSRAVIQFGLLLLIATPVARVFFSLIGFILERDKIYIVITTIVLFILCLGLFSSYLTF
ncbi:MAG TPA: DUF1634 domain-containing protein [Prolixibacteraceae bacterium]